MIVVDVEQGTPEWLAARIGIPTASQFSRIITKSGAPSRSQDGYICELVAEQLLGESLDTFRSDWMERGIVLEPQALASYEFAHDCDTQKVGFVLRDDQLVGCSPDRLVGKDGILEQKCLGPAKHIRCVLQMDEDGGEFRQQIQGQLWICERDWCDLASFCPELPRAEVRIYRDEEYIKALETHMRAFLEKLESAKSVVAGRMAA